MMGKIYKSLSGAKQVLSTLVFAMFSVMAFSQTTYTFNYTGSAQAFTMQPGSYSISCWGANGGDGGGTTVSSGSGGKGGFSTGIYSVAATTTVYVYVGGQGQSNNTTVATSITALGGWNGGGGGYNGSYNATSLYKGGGGGGSDVRTSLNTTYSNRIIVAGGGGGGGGATSSAYQGLGGNGGGSTGQDGVLGSSQTAHNGKGGSQTAGGAGGVYGSSSGYAGSLGVGGDGGSISGNYFPAGGGGGGYYGGGGGATQGGSGGGGSSYTGGVTSGTTIMSGQTGFVSNPVTTGDGLVLIKELCNITMSATGLSVGNSLCSGNSVTLTTSAVSNYSWSTGANTASIVISPTTSGIYTVTGTSSLSCNASASLSITVNGTVPVLSVVNTSSANGFGVCPGRTVNLNASGAITYTWSGLNNVTNGVSFTPTVSSDYTVSGQNGCGVTTVTTQVTLYTNPSVSITALTGSICSGNTTTMSVSGSNYVTNTITTSLAAPQVTDNVSFTPAATNTYIVMGTSAQGCTATANTTLQVVQTPTLAPTSTTLTLCTGKSATLSASGASGYTWTTGSSTVATTSSFVVNPTSTTTYSVTKNNSTCFNTQAITITSAVTPTVGAIALTGSICSGNTTTISVTGNSTTNTITSVLAGPPVTNNVGFTPAVTNTYIATGSANGCTASATASVQVIQTPTLAPTSSTMILCIGKSATLTATGATGGYTWTIGTSTLSTSGNTIQVTPNTTTTYSVTKNSSTCFDTKAITIQVNSLTPTFASAVSTLICASRPTTLSAFGGIAYTWYSSAAPTLSFSSSSNPVVSPSVNTTYTVAASDGTCINTAVVSVSTNPNPTINVVTTSTNICIGAAVTLSANGGQSNNYTWTSVPATATVTGQYSIAPSFPVPGAYAFSATGDNQYNCTSTTMTVIIVNPGPTLTANATKTLICSGGTTTLQVTGASSYQWDANANSASTATTVVNPTSTTVYNVTGTLSSTQCTASTSTIVQIYTPTISITTPTNTCYGALYTLTGSVNNPASGANNSYTWTIPGGQTSNGTNVQVTPTVLTVYTLTAKSTTLGNLTCTESKTTSLGIFYNPTVSVAPTRTFVCRNEPINLVASGADTYTWNSGAYSGSLITVTHANVGTVAYTVVGTDANGCKNDTIYYLKINGCQGIEEQNQNNGNVTIYPNPNDGIFSIVSDGDMKLTLINELGQVVKEFELNAYNEHKAQVADLAKGIYFISGSGNNAITRQKIIIK